MNPSTAWDVQDPTLSGASQDDFQFLDMEINNLGDGMNFDFEDFATQNEQMLRNGDGDVMNTGIGGNSDAIATKEAMLRGQVMTSPADLSGMTNTALDMSQSGSSIDILDAQIQYLQHQRRQQQQRQLTDQQQRQFYAQAQHMVPQTPNSVEMHSSDHQYFHSADAHQQAIYENYQMQMKEREMDFTPLVSPAVTPLDTHFNLPDYSVVPGAYFSPLSSPALHAQNERRTTFEHQLSASANGSTDKLADLKDSSSPLSIGKRSTKKVQTTPKTRAMRQSPIVKPQRKAKSSKTISPQTLSDIIEPGHQQQNMAQAQVQAQSQNFSRSGTEESISPEHLSDMAPPPKPRSGSARNSPYLTGQNQNPRPTRISQLNGPAMSPATPASLMKLVNSNHASPSVSNNGELIDHPMEDFSLPEAANPAHSRQDLHLDVNSAGLGTPVSDAPSALTPGLKSLPSPAFGPPSSLPLSRSPQIPAQVSSYSATSTPSARKTPLMSGRGSKKRQSVSSVQVSPALRPRISPSIKPLIRGGIGSSASINSISDDTASLLLASKSNYQNILEGTHLPGINYPTELSTNLTSKRTSHKIAEQGRRNRINSALQEIATLLPKSCTIKDGTGIGAAEGEGEGEIGEKGARAEAEEKAVDDSGDRDINGEKTTGGVQSSNSKASTVELAIEYIKQLKKDLEIANKRAEEAERKLEGKA